MRIFVLLLTCLVVASCGENKAPPPKIFSPYIFADFVIPGVMENAKQSGFVNCNPKQGEYLCQRATKTFIEGVAVSSASVTLNSNNNFLADGFQYENQTNSDNKNLSYRYIHFSLPETKYSDHCLDAIRNKEKTYNIWPHPIECRKNEGVDYLRHVLVLKGWVEHSARGGHIYLYRKDTPLQFTFQLGRTDVMLEPINLQEANSKIQEITERRNKEALKAQQDNELIDLMRAK